MNNNSNKTRNLIIGVLLLVVGGVAGYFIGNGSMGAGGASVYTGVPVSRSTIMQQLDLCSSLKGSSSQDGLACLLTMVPHKSVNAAGKADLASVDSKSASFSADCSGIQGKTVKNPSGSSSCMISKSQLNIGYQKTVVLGGGQNNSNVFRDTFCWFFDYFPGCTTISVTSNTTKTQ